MPEVPYDQLPMLGIDPLLDQQFLVRKRDGRLEEFNEARIHLAIEGAFKAVLCLAADDRLPDDTQWAANQCADAVTASVLTRAVKGEQLEVEGIQDTIEEQLMLAGHVEVARRFILYRETRRQARVLRDGDFDSITVEERSPTDDLAMEPPLAANFPLAINQGQFLNLLAPELLDFDLEKLALHLRPERDALLSETARVELRDGCMLKENGQPLEDLQGFWMRLALGLALNEGDQAETRALEFYEALSTLGFLPSAAILSGGGSPVPRLALCHAISGAGTLEQVSGASAEPSTCIWLEPWHVGVFDFLRSYYGGQTLSRALWVPDLFLRRAEEKGRWTLFDPSETPDLHALHGPAFEKRYLACEEAARTGRLQYSREVEAEVLWRKILESIHEGGGIVLGLKDAVNIRAVHAPVSGLRHAGVGDGFVSSAPGVLGAINLPQFLTGDAASPLHLVRLRATVSYALRMLDNALDLSIYPTAAERELALANRVVGLGMSGFEEALERSGISAASPEAAEFGDRCAEALAWCGIMASAELAAERGPCQAFVDSKWRNGSMPFDTLMELDQLRVFGLSVDRSSVLDWNIVRRTVARNGMRHSSVTSGAPEAVSGPPSFGASGDPDADVAAVIESAARRQKWIDMAQPISFPCPGATIEELGRWYLSAWRRGLKVIQPPMTAGQIAQTDLPTVTHGLFR